MAQNNRISGSFEQLVAGLNLPDLATSLAKLDPTGARAASPTASSTSRRSIGEGTLRPPLEPLLSIEEERHEAELRAKDEIIAGQKAELDRLRAEREQVRAERYQVVAAHQSLLAELEQLRVAHAEAQAERDKAHVERDRLAAELRALRGARRELPRTCGELRVWRAERALTFMEAAKILGVGHATLERAEAKAAEAPLTRGLRKALEREAAIAREAAKAAAPAQARRSSERREAP